MFTQSAKYYDALYRALGKDYAAESARIKEIVAEHKRTAGNALLDVACGTGKHIERLRDDFACEGVDIDRNLLAVAAERNPGVPMDLADMISFNLGKRYDAIVCLFGSIGYAPNTMRLDQTLSTFAKHLNPGGVVLLEPWFTPDQWRDGQVNALYVDEPNLKIARMNVSRRDGNVAVLHFHYMVASTDGIRTFTEPHRLTLFTREEYESAFRKARLSVSFDERGLIGRGLFIGTQPIL
ncbi:MAG TPA: class I SAM-dependent methyltransferase [Candidatus Baltobacteraceae bacterium]|jgi:SAM-dependent methyltransferase